MSSNRIEDSPLPFEVNTIPRKPDPMIIKLDPDLEAWYTYRESTHRYFQVNKSNILYIIVFVGLLPYGLFHALKRDLERYDEFFGREFIDEEAAETFRKVGYTADLINSF